MFSSISGILNRLVRFVKNLLNRQGDWFKVRQETLKAVHTSTPRVITVDKNPAYPKAIKELIAAKKLPEIVKLRQIKYLNNIVEQDHPCIKRLVKLLMGFGSFNTARRTIKGYEIMNMMRKGQIVGVPTGAVKERILFLNQIFGVVA